MSSSKTDGTLPPGMVLGPDGKPCKICTSFRNWKPPSKKTTSTTKDFSNPSPATAIATATASAASAAHDDDVARLRRAHCPPDSEALGRATWTFLHTTAAYYPERPSPTQRAHMLQLLHALPTLYPCGHCADDLGERIRSRPPEVGSRAALGAWLCATHNEVNALLGKPTFDCARVDERWKDGPKDGSCD
ncbi:ERV/ALR sulfhydryl oxidase domain-containing protein [Lactarius vividus]|nr:ERV/ALR sulfhydryl oxidase domain-containing protein [Lactarius vividus]